MITVKDIIERMENKPTIVHISSREDREENKKWWKYYYQRTHRRSREHKYNFEEWKDINEYLSEHREN